MVSGTDRVDAVIPVFNAPEATRRCIESIYRHAGERISRVYVHDNASDAPTREMLDSLDFPGLEVHHALENTGFGDAVNRGVRWSRGPLVLVLNSDVVAQDDFVTPLLEALARDRALAAVTPAGNSFASTDLERVRSRAGCAITHNLYAYGFLMRRAAFDEMGGFDPAFGLGYYEDTDLSRKWIHAGYGLGICRASTLYHEIHASFHLSDARRALMDRNRTLYFSRYPSARRRVLLLTHTNECSRLPKEVRERLEAILRDGGKVDWWAPRTPDEVLALEMRGRTGGLLAALRAVVRRRKRTFGRYTDLWVHAPSAARARTLHVVANLLRARFQTWPG